ncbi:MAG: hypothetical protein ACR2MF_10645 [Chthoniobacterales bacterium]
MRKILSALLLSATSALAQNNPTAYDALRAVGNQLNRDAINRVVGISGVEGNPQPETWHILLSDRNTPAGVREVDVTNGRVGTQRAPTRDLAGTARGATVDTRKLNLDSSGAYEVANKTADSSHVPFAFVSYTLRTDDRGNPTWIVTLLSQNRRALGTIYIGANKGTVTRTEGMFQGLPANEVVEDQREGHVEYEARSGDGPIVGRARELFYRARDNARDTFKRVRRNFADFIRGED